MSQPSCVFNNCCGCIELRCGCLIIGYFQLVVYLLFVVIGILMLIGGSMAAAQDEGQRHDTDVALMAVVGVFLFVVFFSLAFTIVLLVGVHKNKRGHLKAYLICSSLMVLVVFAIALRAPSYRAGVIVARVIGVPLVYFLMVIRSFYYKLDDNKPAVYNTA